MGSPILLLCWFAIATATIPEETMNTYKQIAAQYDRLATETVIEVDEHRGDRRMRLDLLSVQASVQPGWTIVELEAELKRIVDTVALIIGSLRIIVARAAGHALARPRTQLENARGPDRLSILELIRAWSKFRTRIVEFSVSLSSTKEVPPGKPGPPPPPPTTTTYPPEDADSNKYPFGPTTSIF